MVPTNVSLMRRVLVAFIRNEVRKVGLERVVVGLSGGVDSSLSAMLAAEALGPGQVLGIMMPYRDSSAESVEHARLVVEKSGIRSDTVEITPQIDAYFAAFPDADPKRRGNKMARERMTILYDHSARWDALVAGTSNKTELLLGYGTLHGDMASALNPLGDLYKTQVWALSEAVGVPEAVVSKEPSADLWAGQTDEAELGFSYRRVDELLYLMVDQTLWPGRARGGRVRARFHRRRRPADHDFPVQAPPSRNRQGVPPDHRPGLPVLPGLGQVTPSLRSLRTVMPDYARPILRCVRTLFVAPVPGRLQGLAPCPFREYRYRPASWRMISQTLSSGCTTSNGKQNRSSLWPATLSLNSYRRGESNAGVRGYINATVAQPNFLP